MPGIGKVATVVLKIVKAVATLYLQRESEAGEFLADPSRLENFWRMRLGALPTRCLRSRTWTLLLVAQLHVHHA